MAAADAVVEAEDVTGEETGVGDGEECGGDDDNHGDQGRAEVDS